MNHKFIVTGGGTSGHINPAITIADALKKYYADQGDTCEVIFTGRSEGLEGELVPKAGYELKNIVAKPFPMKPSIKMIKALKAFRQGRKQCRQIIKEFQPDAVIGTGGYVCAPLLMEASKLKVPVVIHEANAFPGRANRMMGRKADLVLTGFPNQEKDFPKAKRVVFTGNPIREMVIGTEFASSREKLGVPMDAKFVFAMGGSLGAKTINDFMIEAAGKPEFADVKFVLSSGKQQTKILNSGVKIPDNLTVLSYIDNPNDYMAAADVSILRAGAVTCAETAAIGACAIFIPYPYAAHDHQTYNANTFVKEDGAVLVPDATVAEGELYNKLNELLNDEIRRMQLREGAKKLAVLDCSDRIVKAIVETLK